MPDSKPVRTTYGFALDGAAPAFGGITAAEGGHPTARVVTTAAAADHSARKIVTGFTFEALDLVCDADAPRALGAWLEASTHGKGEPRRGTVSVHTPGLPERAVAFEGALITGFEAPALQDGSHAAAALSVQVRPLTTSATASPALPAAPTPRAWRVGDFRTSWFDMQTSGEFILHKGATPNEPPAEAARVWKIGDFATSRFDIYRGGEYVLFRSNRVSAVRLAHDATLDPKSGQLAPSEDPRDLALDDITVELKGAAADDARAWHAAAVAGKSVPRGLRIEYLDPDGAPLFEVEAAVSPKAVTEAFILGPRRRAVPVTKVRLYCEHVRFRDRR